MENQHWKYGLLLLVLLSTTDLSLQVSDIKHCQHIDALSVVCTWKKSQNHSKMRLFYNNQHRIPCYSQCQPTLNIANSSEEYCEFENRVVEIRYTLFLAPLESCFKDSYSKCWNCSVDLGKIKEMRFYPENVVLTLSPRNLRIETNSILKWDAPDSPGSMLDFVLLHSHPTYKLEYREVACSSITSPNYINKIWQLWYEGNKTTFSPLNLTPGCTYESRVFAALPKTDAKPSWGKPSNPIQFLIENFNPPFVSDVSTRETTTDDSHRTDFELFGSLAISFFFLLILVGGCVFRKNCARAFPSKIKVPKPIIMIPLKELQEESNNLYISETFTEEKVATLQPFLCSFFRDVGSKRNLTKNEAVPDDDEKSTSSVNILSTECCETNELLEIERFNNSRNIQLEDAFDSNTFHRDSAASNLSNFIRIDTTSDSVAGCFGSLIEEATPQSNEQEESDESSDCFVSSTESDTIPNREENENYTRQPIFSRQYPRSPLDYVDYVTDNFKEADIILPIKSQKLSSEGNITKTSSYHEELTLYDSDHPGSCYHRFYSPDYNTSGFSSLPSVAGDYFWECFPGQSPTSRASKPPKSRSRLVCSCCSTRISTQSQVDKHKRNSLGELSNVFETFKSFEDRNHHREDGFSLDSGCNFDLTASPT